MTADLNNPYAPPTEVTEPPWSLPPDTEFLFNDEFIAAVGKLSLPKICVLTGQRTELVQRTSTLRATPRWLQVIPAVVFALVLPGMLYFVTNVTGPPPSAGPWNLMIVLVFIAAFAIPFFRRRTLKLTWYLAQSEIDRFKRQQKQWSLVLLAVGLLVLAISWAFGAQSATILTMLMFVVCTLLVVLSSRSAAVLSTVGCYKNLVLVKGFKEPFLLELRAMIVRFETRGDAQHVTETTAHGNEKIRKFST